MRKKTKNYLQFLLTLVTITTQQSFGQGFEKSPTSWSTPFTIDQITDFSSGVKHTTMDISGDNKPDLVVTYNNGFLGSVGDFRWDVYLNNGSGFNNTPVSWNTPFNLDQITDFSSGVKHTTMDISGDSKPDLIVTYNNGFLGSVGDFRWDVYLNNGSGFNNSPTSWSTPFELEQITDFSSGVKHTTMDINGDNKLDLVVTYYNGYLGSVGDFRWDVYLNLSTLSVKNLNNHSLDLKSYPNPTNDIFFVEGFKSPLRSVTIYNSSGQEIYREKGLNENNFRFDLKNFPNGLYFIQLESNHELNTIKILRN